MLSKSGQWATDQFESRIPSAAEAGMKDGAYGAAEAAPFQNKIKLSYYKNGFARDRTALRILSRQEMFIMAPADN